MNFLSNFNERLSELIFEKELDNKTLAKGLGVHHNTLLGWRRGATYLRIQDLIKLADYFNCSLDFLAKRTDKDLDYTPQEHFQFRPDEFYFRLRNIMEKYGKTAYQMGKETKIKDSYLSKWKHGQNVHILCLLEISNYLDVSLDVLVGRDITN